MSRRLRWLVVLQAAVIVVLAALLLRPHAAPAPAPVTAPAGAPAPEAGTGTTASGEAFGRVHLSREVQQSSGVRLASLRAARAPQVGESWGEVVTTQGLADARLRLRQAAVDAAQYDEGLLRARRERERLDALWADGGNVAHKLVDQAHAEQAQLEQRQAAARSLQEAVRAAVRSEWGAALLQQLELPDGGALSGLLAGSERLLLLPVGSAPRGEVGVPGQPGLHVAVRRLAPAIQAVAGAREPSWYWLASADALRVGERVHMHSDAGAGSAGVEVPESAVVWQSGQAWVYQPDDPEQFHRVAVALGAALERGWFAAAPLAAGQQVVVQGAQLLLSEESRALIRNENGD